MLPIRPSITIPNPTPEGMAKFKKLYREIMGEDLDDDKAQNLATRFLHFAFFGLTEPPMAAGSKQGKPDGAIHSESPTPR